MSTVRQKRGEAAGDDLACIFPAQGGADVEAEEGVPPCHITAFTTGAAQVRDEALPYPAKATVAGPLRVIPREMPGMTAASVGASYIIPSRI